METLRQVGISLLLAAFSVALVIGGISLALAESYVPDIPTPTQTQALMPVVKSATPQALVFTTETLPAVPLASETTVPPTSCPPPLSWIAISVQAGDNLASLALRYQSTPEELSRANCLFSSDLPTGSILYVPPALPAKTVVSCGRPAGWNNNYSVQAGNTMYSISHAYGISVSQLQYANCIPTYQYSIVVGQILAVPSIAKTRTPLATATVTLTPVSIIFPTLTRTSTPTQVVNTLSAATATNTTAPTATNPPATAMPSATATVIVNPSQTPGQ